MAGSRVARPLTPYSARRARPAVRPAEGHRPRGMRHQSQRRRGSGWHRREWPQARPQADYIPHHEPFEYYASTANPHHVAPTSLQAVGHDTQTYTDGKPNFDTANHQYDMSTFDKLVPASRRDSSARPAPGGQLPQGGRLPGRTPPTPTRSTSSSSSSTRSTRWRRPRTGRARRSSSPTTTPTAGTTTPSAASPTPPECRRRADRDWACGSGQPLAGQMGRAASARGCRCSSSRHGPAPTSWTVLSQPGLDHPLHRRQLASGPDQGVVRFRVAQSEPDVQLRPQAREEQGPAARPHHGSAPEEDAPSALAGTGLRMARVPPDSSGGTGAPWISEPPAGPQAKGNRGSG